MATEHIAALGSQLCQFLPLCFNPLIILVDPILSVLYLLEQVHLLGLISFIAYVAHLLAAHLDGPQLVDSSQASDATLLLVGREFLTGQRFPPSILPRIFLRHHFIQAIIQDRQILGKLLEVLNFLSYLFLLLPTFFLFLCNFLHFIAALICNLLTTMTNHEQVFEATRLIVYVVALFDQMDHLEFKFLFLVLRILYLLKVAQLSLKFKFIDFCSVNQIVKIINLVDDVVGEIWNILECLQSLFQIYYLFL